jgi:uncharacterized protein (DUF1697 family)
VTTCIAFLRGINVGKAKRIAIADLRALVAVAASESKLWKAFERATEAGATARNWTTMLKLRANVAK